MSNSITASVNLEVVRCLSCSVIFAMDAYRIVLNRNLNAERGIYQDNIDEVVAAEPDDDDNDDETVKRIDWLHCPNGHKFTYTRERPIEKPKPKSKAERRAKIIAAHEREQAEARERDKPKPSSDDGKSAA